ncbi:MAG: hypothetical protein ACI9X0_001512 [Kiritimatiellia bacterium]|jgi:hypothetical protein
MKFTEAQLESAIIELLGVEGYELAKSGTLKLIPPERILHVMRKDYDSMQEMIFGRHPSFDDIIHGLQTLEAEINAR